MTHSIACWSLVACVAAATACSSSSAQSSGGADSGVQDSIAALDDAGPDVIDNPNNCVKPGTASNAEGVGGYCSPGGGQCAKAGPGGSPTLCTADYSPVMNVWFCTVPCNPGNCGAGARCVTTAMGSGCTPTSCLGYLGDAGTLDDGSTATPDGGSGDAGTTDSAAGD